MTGEMRGLFYGIVTYCLPNLPWNYGPIGHLKVIKLVFPQVLLPGTIAIDATCGNGYDALFLASLCLQERNSTLRNPAGRLHCIDIQPEALDSTKKRLSATFPPEYLSQVSFHSGSHETFPAEISPGSVSLICYNLGYLPGLRRKDDNFVRTNSASTLKSLQNAVDLLKQDGMISVTAYRGHEGGNEETNAVETFMSSLHELDWRVYAHIPLNRPQSPILYMAYKIGKPQRPPASQPKLNNKNAKH